MIIHMSECMAVWVGERQRRKKVLLIGLFLQYFALCEKSVTFSLDYNFFFPVSLFLPHHVESTYAVVGFVVDSVHSLHPFCRFK